MNAPKFAPAPWHFREGRTPNGMFGYIEAADHDRIVCDLPDYKHPNATDEYDEHNGRLIAAAPELLAAAECAQAWISDMPHGDNCYLSAHYDGDPGNQCNCGKESVLTALEAVIAKAVQP